MTVQSQIQQTLAQAQSVQASLIQFSLETENQQVKKMYEKLAEEQKNLCILLEGRYQIILQEEPQFTQNR